MPRTSIFSRNFPIISNGLQRKISSTTILFIGCGLGSNIAVLAARVGFKKFIIADGDTVEKTNLNRQEYDLGDVGKNKARALAAKLRAISPSAKIDVVQRYLENEKIIESLVKKSNLIINTADFSRGFFEVIRRAKKHSKWVLCPFNVGFGSAVIVFNKNNSDLVDSFDSLGLKENQFFIQLLKQSKSYRVPKYFLPTFKRIVSGSKISYTPQVAPASFTTASLVVSILLSIVGGSTVKIFPRVNSVDLRYV